MSIYERILVPTDLSPFGDLALRYAALFATRLGSQLTLLHAADLSFADYIDLPAGYYLETIPAAKQRLYEALREHVRKHLPRALRVETLVVDDRAPHAIVQAAEDVGADLIVMGTHGRSGLSRAFLGSVTERVLRDAHCPVMTVRPPLFPGNADIAIHNIFCPAPSTYALAEARALVQAFDARLIARPVGDDRILPMANDMGADLIVLGRMTERITRSAQRPVLTIGRNAAAARAAA